MVTDSVRRYRILETLGRGGFGTVYRAELLAAGGFTKQVALKMLSAEGQASEQVVQRLRDEARILGLIRHRAIVGVDSLTEIGSGWAVVMEYVPGVDVTMLVSHGPPPARVSLEITEEVASALHAAFNEQNEITGQPLRLVHRDVKPANIRITGQGEVKILDFGVAQATFEDREARTSQMLFGSFRYMAPERIEGIEDPAGDIFGLGIVLAEMLSAARFKAPPKDRQRFEDFQRFIRGAIDERLQTFTPPVAEPHRERLIALVERMMAFDMERRPLAKEVEQACRDLRAELPGPWLRDWAETEVPRLQSLARQQFDDPMSGSMLAENTMRIPVNTGAPAVERVEADAEDEAQAVALRYALIGASICAVVAVLVLVLFGVMFWGREDAQDPVAAAPVEAPAPVPVAAPPPPDEVAAPVEPAPVDPPVEAPVEAPPPKAEPAPKAVKAAKEPSPTPPAPSTPGGTVKLSGDARNAWLTNSAGKKYPVGSGSVPPGTYDIKAWFDGSTEGVAAGQVTVSDGESVTLKCSSMMLRCTKAR
jgi:serine/threonine-protein kinase